MQFETSHTAVPMQELGIDLSELLEGTGISAGDILRSAQPKAEETLTGRVARELTAEDIANCAQAVGVGISQSPPIKTLRDRHHKAAQLMAQGTLTLAQISQVTGYSQSRLSVLQADPSFAELLSMYRNQREEIFTDTVTKMKALTDDAVEVLQERLEHDPDAFKTEHLLTIVTKVADRAGFSPVQKSMSVSTTISPDQLSAMKERARQRQIGQVKQITQESAHATHQTIKSVEGIEVGEVSGMSSLVLEAPETQGVSGEGTDIRTDGGEEIAG